MTRLSRRQFVVGTAGVGVLVGCGRLPWQAEQPAKVPRVGYLASGSLVGTGDFADVFRERLRDLGWVEGQNIAIEYRAAENEPNRYHELAAELVRLPVDLVLVTGTAGALATKQATSTIPIVMVAAGDPVGSGLVASYARPGENLTGMSQSSPLLSAKRVELLKQLKAGISSVAVFSNPSNPANDLEWEETQAAGEVLGVQLHILEVRNGAALPSAFEAAMRERATGLIVFSDPVLNAVTAGRAIVEFAAGARVPAIYAWKAHVARGGLMAYGPDPRELYRRAAYYVDRILKGTPPADLPIEQPMTFDFVVNLKTAEALGITFPHEVALQITEVIE